MMRTREHGSAGGRVLARVSMAALLALNSACTFNAGALSVAREARGEAMGWTTLRVDTSQVDTDISITGSDDPAPHATATLVLHAGTDDATLQQAVTDARFEFVADGTALALSYAAPTAGEFLRVIDVELTAPRGAALELHGRNHFVTARGLTGNVVGDGASGGLRVETSGLVQMALTGSRFAGAAGGGTIGTTSGFVEVAWSGAAPLAIVSDAGTVTVRVPRGVGVALDLSVMRGSLIVAIDGAQTPSGTSYTGRVGGGGPTLSVRSNTGSISVTH